MHHLCCKVISVPAVPCERLPGGYLVWLHWFLVSSSAYEEINVNDPSGTRVLGMMLCPYYTQHMQYQLYSAPQVSGMLTAGSELSPELSTALFVRK